METYGDRNRMQFRLIDFDKRYLVILYQKWSVSYGKLKNTETGNFDLQLTKIFAMYLIECLMFYFQPKTDKRLRQMKRILSYILVILNLNLNI